jgi:hypothetical protein
VNRQPLHDQAEDASAAKRADAGKERPTAEDIVEEVRPTTKASVGARGRRRAGIRVLVPSAGGAGHLG